ncbi:MAG TPA: tetratricopeptide repeat protein [Candidatus Polarisedimenticolaceae bacterium]|nr:tetratricopeptide repeat protein [Candidatus Polarisedimenticolaceae bacterium]
MKGYTVDEVAKLLSLSPGRVRSFARAGFLEPQRGDRGEYRFSFQDLVLLRTAQGLIESRVAPRRVRRALRELKQRLPSGRPLTGVQIVAEGGEVVVHDGEQRWSAGSGQAHFNFDVADLARKAAPVARRAAQQALRAAEQLGVDDWFALGAELEATAPEQARDAYRRVLELDPDHVEARVNLGRLLHEAGQIHAAEAHYRLALGTSPRDATAWFNLGVSLEDMGRIDEAVRAYQDAIAADADCADAYFNLARLYEKLGDARAALRHLKTYRRLTGQ